jgi:hypothetical protein
VGSPTFITSRSTTHINSHSSPQLYLLFICCLFVVYLIAARRVRELLFFRCRGRGGAKIAWPRRANGPSQIHSGIDRYASLGPGSATAQSVFKNICVLEIPPGRMRAISKSNILYTDRIC